MAESSLSGKKVIVIGGTSGIGFGVALAAQEAGAAVVVGSSSAAKVEAALGRLGGAATGSAVDVTNDDDVAAFFKNAGAFNHLVYTAGDWATQPVDWDLERAQAAFAVRFWGAVRAIKYARETIAEDGSITLTDGTLAHRPRRGAAVSTAMLGAVEHLAVGLAVELAPLRVNAICPGFILTEASAGIPEERLQEMTKRQPLPRIGQPAEIAEAYLYLMRGTFTTGQVLHVDGGRTLV